MLGRPVAAIELNAAEHASLKLLTGRRKTAQNLAMRARIILLGADGLSSKAVADHLGVSQAMVGKWRRRFCEMRVDGLYVEPRSGGPRTMSNEKVEAVIVRTLESQPANATHWSSREMAKASGVSASSVLRIWRAFGLQPHRAETFKLSKDPLFIDKARIAASTNSGAPSSAAATKETKSPNPSNASEPPINSSTPSNAIAKGSLRPQLSMLFLIQDTRASRDKSGSPESPVFGWSRRVCEKPVIPLCRPTL